MCAVERRGTAPGQKTAGKSRHEGLGIRPSVAREAEDAPLLRRSRDAVQKLFPRSARVPGQTGRTFLQLLERRLDNVVYRLNLAQSRAQARQLVTHRHFKVNGRIVNVPSYVVRAGRHDHDRAGEPKVAGLRREPRSGAEPAATGLARMERRNEDCQGAAAASARADRHAGRRAAHRRVLLALTTTTTAVRRTIVCRRGRRADNVSSNKGNNSKQ